MTHPCTITPKHVDTLMNSLQQSVDNLIYWTEVNHMALHVDKTKIILLTTRQRKTKFCADSALSYH